MQDMNITVIQSDLIWKDRQANLSNFTAKINLIDKPSDLIILPEMFNTGFVVDPDDVAEKADGMTMAWLKDMARLKKCIVTGSLIIEDHGHYYNRLIWMKPDGSYELYDKRHLFSFAQEHQKFHKGMKKLVVELHDWRIHPLVCYDLRFPVWSKNTMNNGAFDYDILLYIANWPSQRSHAWKSLLVARSIENLSYVIGVNRIGEDGHGNQHAGDTMIISPAGEIIFASEPFIESTASIQLSREELVNFRNRFAFGNDWDNFTIIP
jgi:predicted amidohydrolase